MDNDVPDLIRFANEDFDSMEEGNSEIDDETPMAVLLPEKQSKDPGRIAVFNLLIYNLKAKGLVATPTDDGFPTRPFRVRFWTDPGNETIHWANTFEYGPNPSWPDRTAIRFNTLVHWGFLYVEIVRYGVEPCTSIGDSTVGRAKIRLPREADVQVSKSCELVKSDGGECSLGVGHFKVTMKWERVWTIGAI